ncbi:MAG: ATPase [Actinobacteria bacterium HGW-Actinobacteria-4]|nr:MAG: ATPase [Actinobacteria bacterium HGW-Actinobacteria-4]
MTDRTAVAAAGSVPGPPIHDDADRRADRRDRAVALVRRSGAVVMLAVTLVAGTAGFGLNFVHPNNLLYTVAAGSAFLALVAIGMTFVIITGGIDLSVGAVLAMSAVIAAWASAQWGGIVGISFALGAAGLVGLGQGVLISMFRLPPFIVTLAGMQFARGIAFKVTDEGNQTVLIGDIGWLRWLGRGTVLGIPVPVLIALIAFAIGSLVLARTRTGQVVFAIGGSPDAASLMGLPVRRVTTSVYVWSALLAGMAGVLIAARSSTGEPTAGYGMELQAIAAVVIGGALLTGGAGKMSGTLAGVALLAVIQNLINQVGTLSQYFQDVVSGGFLLGVVLLQAGLARRRRSP